MKRIIINYRVLDWLVTKYCIDFDNDVSDLFAYESAVEEFTRAYSTISEKITILSIFKTQING